MVSVSENFIIINKRNVSNEIDITGSTGISQRRYIE